MRQADLEKFRKSLLKFVNDPEQLIDIAVQEHEGRVDAENKMTEVQHQQNALYKEHQRSIKEADKLREDYNKLMKAFKDVSDQLAARVRDCYGRPA